MREALANCLINADYYGRQGIVVIKRPKCIIISNPGTFRLDLKEVVIGGVSDPRNTTLMKMFNLIDVGERAGSGIPNIFRVWDEQQWTLPVIEEKFNPERSTLYLYLTKSTDKKSAEKIGRKNRQKKYLLDGKNRFLITFLSLKQQLLRILQIKLTLDFPGQMTICLN